MAVLGAAVAVWLAVATMSTTTDAAAVLEGDYGEWVRSVGEEREASYGLPHAMPSFLLQTFLRRSYESISPSWRAIWRTVQSESRCGAAAQPGMHARTCLRAWLLSPLEGGIFDAYFRPLQDDRQDLSDLTQKCNK